MKNLFASTHIAYRLSNLEFDEPCFGYYITNDDDGDGIDVKISEPIRNSGLVNGAFTAPTYQQVTDFLREKYGLNIFVSAFIGTHEYQSQIYPVTEAGYRLFGSAKTVKCSSDYYECLKYAIEKTLKLI